MKENISMDENLETTIDGNNLGNEDPEFITHGHVLMNIVVLDRIVRHLGFRDILNFRLVCPRWNDVSEIVFWKLSRIKIINAEKESKNQFASFEQTFPSPGLPSQAIVFEGPVNRTALDYFLKERWALTNIHFRFSPNKIDLNYYSTRNVTTLKVMCHSYCKVSLENFPNIENLVLYNCEIVLNGKITPREITFGCFNTLVYQGRIFKPSDWRHSHKILINTFVNFSKMKKLYLIGNFWKVEVGNDAIELENLDVLEAELIGLRNSQWTTNRFHFIDKISVGDKIEIKSVYGQRDFDIEFGALANSIENWSLTAGRPLADPQIFRYPNLKCLTLGFALTFPILDLTNCTSLANFGLYAMGDMCKLDFNKIKLPACTRKVKLYNVDVTTEAPWQLDTLILDKYSFSLAKTVSQHFKTVKLGINFNTVLFLDENRTSILNICEYSNIQKLAIGRVSWSDTNLFRKWICSSPEPDYWVQIARFPVKDYYLFTKEENAKGRPISVEEFIEHYYLY